MTEVIPRSTSLRLLTRIEPLACGSLMAEISRRCHDAYADQFEAEVGDPLY